MRGEARCKREKGYYTGTTHVQPTKRTNGDSFAQTQVRRVTILVVCLTIFSIFNIRTFFPFEFGPTNSTELTSSMDVNHSKELTWPNQPDIVREVLTHPLDIPLHRLNASHTCIECKKKVEIDRTTERVVRYNKKDTTLLGCDEIAKLEIVRRVGVGRQKVAYEVKLPWGEHAVAKRCIQESCIKMKWLEKEANLTRELHEQYGDQGLRYFGECDAAYTDTNTIALKKTRIDFSVGFTSVLELGIPMLPSWKMKDTKCFAEFYTETDIEDFRNIARLFANFSMGSVILRTPIKNDNIHPQQYMRSVGGSSEGRIKLLDLDHLERCKMGETFSNTNDCTFNAALKENCKIMAELTNISNLNCSLPVSSNSRTKPVHNFAHDRINASDALIECTRRNEFANQ